MSNIGSEVTKKVKDAIKAKLLEIGAYVDDELPDYIMVLVANKKNKEQMDEDLSLFLGHNTERFTAWLHSVLQKLNAASALQAVKQKEEADNEKKGKDSEVTKEKPVKHKEKKEKKKDKKKKKEKKKEKKEKKEKDRDKEKREREKENKVVSENEADNTNKNNFYFSHNEHKSEEFKVGSMEETGDVVKLRADHSELAALDSDDVKPDNKIKRSSSKEEMAENGDSESSKSKIKKVSSREKSSSSHSTKKVSRVEKYDTSGAGRLLSSSLRSVSNSSDRLEGSRKKLEARVKPLMSSSIKRALSEDEDEVQPKKITKVVSKIGAVIEPEAPKNSLSSKVEIVPRPKRTGAQPNSSLILRAVADAQKSIKTGKRSSSDIDDSPPKRKRLYTKSYREEKARQDTKGEQVTKIAITVPNVRHKVIEDSDQADDSSQDDDEYLPRAPPIMEKREAKTKFIITLDGVKNGNKGIKSRLSVKPSVRTLPIEEERIKLYEDEYIEEVEEWEEEEDEIEEPPALPNLPIKSTVTVPSVAPTIQTLPVVKNPTPAVAPLPAVAPKIEERCMYWPECKDKEKCKFIHPSKKCAAFPKCKFGDSCLYIHPDCKFGTNCMNPNCIFFHGPINKVPVLNKIMCKYFPKCTDMNCPYMHPSKLCRFKSACPNPSCIYIHPEVTYGNKLKWSANNLNSTPYQKINIPSLKEKITVPMSPDRSDDTDQQESSQTEEAADKDSDNVQVLTTKTKLNNDKAVKSVEPVIISDADLVDETKEPESQPTQSTDKEKSLEATIEPQQAINESTVEAHEDNNEESVKPQQE